MPKFCFVTHSSSAKGSWPDSDAKAQKLNEKQNNQEKATQLESI